MADIIIKTIFTFLVIYGFIHLIKSIFALFFSHKSKYDDIVIVIKTKNSEHTLEATVRMILWKCLKLSRGGFIPNILIVDMGSDDATAEIAGHLCRDYSFIEYTTGELYLKAKEG